MMETRREMLDRKLSVAKEKLARIEIDYERFQKVQEDRDYLMARIKKLARLLSEL